MMSGLHTLFSQLAVPNGNGEHPNMYLDATERADAVSMFMIFGAGRSNLTIFPFPLSLFLWPDC